MRCQQPKVDDRIVIHNLKMQFSVNEIHCAYVYTTIKITYEEEKAWK
jgi:hypothetical protein